MITFLVILSYAIKVPNTFLVYQILKSFLPMRGPLVVRLLAFAGCAAITDAIIYTGDSVNFIGGFALFIICMLVFYRGGTVPKLSIVLIIYPMIVSMNFLTQDIGHQVFRMLPVQTEVISIAIHAASLGLRTVLWVFISRLSRQWTRNILKLLNIKMWLLLDSVCIAILTALFVVLNFGSEITQIAYPVALASIIAVLGCIYLAGYIADSVQTRYRLRDLQLEYEYYKGKQNDEERIRAVYHDMKNHLLLLQSASGGEDAMKMITSLQDQISSYENYFKTGNTFLDVILRDKAEKAKERGIDFSVMLHFEDGGFLEPLDISAIFGNAIDNAIEASLKLPVSRRLITVKANRVRDMLSIVIENHTAGEADLLLETTKQDKLLHGLGLKSIEQSTEKYGGQCSVKQADGRFILMIIIPIP